MATDLELMLFTRDAMRTASAQPLFGPFREVADYVGKVLAHKLRYNQAVSLVDVYGAVLAHRFVCRSNSKCATATTAPFRK